VGAARLWRGTEAVRLTAKAWGVLRHLVAQAGQLVTKEELCAVVWETPFVSDASLAVCIREVRQALGDTAQTPQYVETVRGRGYRFVAPVTAPAMAEEPGEVGPLPLVAGPGQIVGREAELQALQQCWHQAQQGRRQIVLVTGEAGIGKTTLVEAWMAQITATAPHWLARGQCVEQHGAGEAYLPLLEALGRLGRGPNGTHLVQGLHQYAPSWLLHLPALVPPEAYEVLERRAGGTTRERMLRELAEAVEVLTAVRPLVLVLEDLHWCDVSTLDWLTSVAQRREAARLLVLGTYRPGDALVQGHPVHRAMRDLVHRGRAVEMVLRPWPPTGVAQYLTQRFGTHAFPVGLVDVLSQRTDGNPLFVVTVMDDLVQQGVVRQTPPGWVLEGDLEAAGRGVPESLRQLIERQFAHLSPTEQSVVEAASVAGVEFSAAVLAAAVDDTVDTVEAQCEALARRGQFVETRGRDEWPDGTVAARYGFLHALYQETIYAQVPVTRRLRWHRQIGGCLEAAYGSRASELATELAEHFRRGRDSGRAVQYFQYAGENAQRRSAHQEAIDHFTTALALLTALPETPERARQELTLHLARGPALAIMRGDAAPEVEQEYLRAQTLCQQLGESAESLLVLHGLWAGANARLQIRQARALGEEYLALAQQRCDQVALVEAHRVLGTSLFYLGEFVSARAHFEQGVARYHLQREYFRGVKRGEDPGVACLAFLVSTLGFLGYPDQARWRAEEAQRLAQELAHPYSLAFARYRASLYALFCRQAPTAQALAEEVLAVATPHGFPFYVALGTAVRGGALVRQGQEVEGLALLRQGLRGLYPTGTQPAPHWLVWQAELAGYAGQREEGLRLLDEAQMQADTTGNTHALAERHRLQGEFILALSAGRASAAETCFYEALAIAQLQQAKALELRAAISLSRLWQHQGKRAEALALLAPVYQWFTEGFDTPDLQEAQALLYALTAS
jgi:DNA-binding winged helix-turn-helix (wHTH) protein/predicted ATPase/type II secretory pathway predicted ATPase ExeA